MKNGITKNQEQIPLPQISWNWSVSGCATQWSWLFNNSTQTSNLAMVQLIGLTWAVILKFMNSQRLLLLQVKLLSLESRSDCRCPKFSGNKKRNWLLGKSFKTSFWLATNYIAFREHRLFPCNFHEIIHLLARYNNVL